MNTVQHQKDTSASWITVQFGPVLRHPSTLLLLAANAIPIYGVLYWAWDVFLLMMLYGLETAIIGIWTIARITTLPPESFGDIARPGTAASPILVAAFFVLHSGIFLAAYLAFLWSEFSGEWASRIHGPIEFVSELIIGTYLWIPLLMLFIVRGFGFLFRWLGPEVIQLLERRLGVSFRTPAPAAVPLGTVIRGFYTRIVILQMTILASGFLAKAFLAKTYGTIMPLIILIAIKTVADGILQFSFDFGSPSRKLTATST